MEMRCYRKILHISYKDHATNEEVRAKIQQATGPHEDLACSLGLIKAILQRTLKGGRRQGREKKRWERQHQGSDRPGFRQVPEGRGKWRKLVVKSSVVPQRPPRSRDRVKVTLLAFLKRQEFKNFIHRIRNVTKTV